MKLEREEIGAEGGAEGGVEEGEGGGGGGGIEEASEGPTTYLWGMRRRSSPDLMGAEATQPRLLGERSGKVRLGWTIISSGNEERKLLKVASSSFSSGAAAEDTSSCDDIAAICASRFSEGFSEGFVKV